MKKLLAILLALAMVLGLAACGADSKDDDDKKEKKNKNEAVEDVESDEDEDIDEDNKDDKDNKNDKNDKDDKNDKNDKDDKNDKNDKNDNNNKPAKDEEASVDLEYGTVSGAEYKNRSLGLEFTRPSSSWQYLSDEELMAIMNATGSVGDAESYLKTYGMFYDMCCMDYSTGDSVQVVVQDLSTFGVSATDFEDAQDEVLDGVVMGLSASLSVTDVSDYKDARLGDNTYRKAVCEFSVSGVSGVMNCYLRLDGDYVVYVVITSFSGNLNAIEDCFG